MSNKLAVSFSAAVTLRAEDFGCFLESQGANEPPAVRKDDGHSLLSFERSVFRLQNAETAIVTSKEERPLPYGCTVRLVCPTTQLCAVVVKTESGSKTKVGFKVVMRPIETAPPTASKFRVLSKYKQRSEMDHVFNGDNVVLLLENSDLFLNLIEGPEGLEIVAALEPSSWTINRYDRGFAFGAKSTIAHAGRVIAFEHRTHTALLTHGPTKIPAEHRRPIQRRSVWQAGETDEDAFANQAAKVNQQVTNLELEPSGDVYFEVPVTQEDTPIEQFECSCNALWIIENADPITGGPLQVGNSYRVRHVSTGRYLTIKEYGNLGKFMVTTMGPGDERMEELSLFDMDASAENDEGHISSYHSFVRLKHCSTAQWLGASDIPPEFSVFPGTANARMSTRDRIILRHPSSAVEQCLFFVRSHAEFLHQYAQRIAELRLIPVSPDRVFNEPEMKKLLERVNETLYSLLQFCSHGTFDAEAVGGDVEDARPDPVNQTMFRELGVLDILVVVLCAPFHGGETIIPNPPLLGGLISLGDIHERVHNTIRGITRTCFRLLAHSIKGNATNAKNAMKYLDLFLYLEQFDLRVADSLHALLENSGCLDSSQIEETAEKFFSLNNTRPLSSYVSSLAQLCMSGGAPRKDAQNTVLRLLEVHPHTLPQQVIELGRLIITPPQRSKYNAKRDGEAALAIELFVSHGDIEMIEYYEACSELLLALAQGNNTPCVDFVVSQVSREHVLLVLQCTFRDAKNINLADSIKAIYTTIAMNLYLRRDIELSTSPRMLVVTQNIEQRVAHISGDGAFVRQMKLIAFDLLKNNVVQVADISGKNRLITNAASIWHLFITARMASSSEIHELVPALISILDGRTDIQSHLAQTADAANADGPLAGLGVGLNKWDRYAVSDQMTAIVSTKIAICDLLQSYVDIVIEDTVSSVGSNIGAPDATPESCHQAAMAIFDSHFVLFDKGKIFQILLDLVLYESQPLVRSAVSLMTQLVTLEARVDTDVSALHLLDPEQSETYVKVVQLIGSLKGSNKSSAEAFITLQLLTAQLRTLVAAEGGQNEAPPPPQGAGSPEKHGEGPEADIKQLEYLELLRTWEVHVMALEMLPIAGNDTKDEFMVVVDFFNVFCVEPKNAEVLCGQWPLFFDAMERCPQMRPHLLPLLSLLWPKGNTMSPVSRGDIRSVVKIFKGDSDPAALKALRAIFGNGAPKPSQQRDVATIMNEEAVFTENWWLSFQPATVLALTNLLTICGQGNSYVRCLFQKTFPVAVVIRLLSSSTLGSLPFKVSLLQFTTTVHLVDNDDSTETASKKAARQAKWVQDEVWWRLVRDDFLVRVDELLTNQHNNAMLRGYTVECALCLDAFFATVFTMSAVSKHEWIMKEIRSCAQAMCHLVATLPMLRVLSSNDKFMLMCLAKTIGQVLTSSNTVLSMDPSVIRLRGLLDTFMLDEEKQKQRLVKEEDEVSNPDASDSDEEPIPPKKTASLAEQSGTPRKKNQEDDEGVRERLVLARTKKLFNKKYGKDEFLEKNLGPIVDMIRPENFKDLQQEKRKIVQKLLKICMHQEVRPDAIVTVLRSIRQMVDSTSETQLIQMQFLVNELGGMTTSTVLLDAVNPHIIRHSLRLGIALLEGGNLKVQNDFLVYLQNTDEKMFVGVKRCMEKAALELQFHRKQTLNTGATSESTAKSNWSLESETNCFFYVQDLLRLTQLLCEGHNLGLQDYIREQKDNLRSVNTIQVVMCFVDVMLKGTFREMEDLLTQSLELLTEFCQGPCPGNQSQLVSTHACAMINSILRNPSCGSEVKEAAVTCLLSIVEGCTDPHVAEIVLREVPIATLEPIFLKISKEENEVNLRLSVGIFLRIMADLSITTGFYYQINRVLKQRPDIGGQTGKIEIMRDNQIELVYFRIPPAAAQIREESKFKLLWEVDRSSQSSKLASFYEMGDELILELDLVEQFMDRANLLLDRHIKNITLRKFLRKLMNPSINYWQIMTVCTCAVINLLLCLGVSPAATIFYPLGAAVLIMSIIVFAIDWEINAKVSFHKYSKLLRHKRAVDKVEYKDDKGTLGKPVSWWSTLWLKMTRGASMACQTIILCSFLGITITPYFFAGPLFWVISLSPSLGNVVAAITVNKKTLSLTIMLGMLVCYAFAIVGFSVFPEDFDTDDDESSHENCNSLSHCFLYIVGTGLRQGGGVGDVMKLKHFGSKNFLGRRVFDFLFFAIMIIVFLNILFGIIIDTFAELRDAKHRKEEDMRLKCFICGIDSHIFDRLGDGFEHHVKHEHNMWQYFYFMHHLRLKDSNDYTGQESYIAKLLEKKDFSFFPSRCISLEGKLGEAQAGQEDTDTASQAAQLQLLGSGMAGGGIGSLLQASNQGVKSQDVREGFDDMKMMMRRLFQRGLNQPAGGALAAPGASRPSATSGTGECRDSSSQTTYGESVTHLTTEVAKKDRELAAAEGQNEKLRGEMRHQVKEIWRLQQTAQLSSDLEHQVHQQQNQLADVRRQLDIALAEKDVMVRQNTFLQREADKLVTANSRMETDARVRGHMNATSDSSFSRGPGYSALKDSLLDRSRLFESLQMSADGDDDAVNDTRSPGRHDNPLNSSSVANTPSVESLFVPRSPPPARRSSTITDDLTLPSSLTSRPPTMTPTRTTAQTSGRDSPSNVPAFSVPPSIFLGTPSGATSAAPGTPRDQSVSSLPSAAPAPGTPGAARTPPQTSSEYVATSSEVI